MVFPGLYDMLAGRFPAVKVLDFVGESLPAFVPARYRSDSASGLVPVFEWVCPYDDVSHEVFCVEMVEKIIDILQSRGSRREGGEVEEVERRSTEDASCPNGSCMEVVDDHEEPSQLEKIAAWRDEEGRSVLVRLLQKPYWSMPTVKAMLRGIASDIC